MKILILAGGFATRLWPLTEKTAKPLIILAGKPLISWIVEQLPPDLEIIVSTNSIFAADFRQWKKEDFPDRSIEIFVEDAGGEQEKKGALFATALVIRERKISDDLFLIAGDNYFGFSLQDFLQDFSDSPEHSLLAAYDIQEKEKAKSFGVVVPSAEAGIVQSFEEKPHQPSSTLVSTGCFIFPKHLLPILCEYADMHRDDLGKIFEHFLTQKEIVRYFSFREKWFDIGSFPAYLEANKFLLEGKVFTEEDVQLAKNTELSGAIFLGKNSHIRQNVVLEDAVIMEGCRLENCTIRNAVIGKNSVISGVDINFQIIRDESFLMK